MAAEHIEKHTSTPAEIQHFALASTASEASLNRLEADPGFAPYSCQTCAKRKVKCDKIKPVCSSCGSRRLQCLYQVPLPRRRKRQLSSGDVYEKLAQYERILLEHGLLPQDPQTSPPLDYASREPVSLRFIEPQAETSKRGKVVVGHGRSRYVNSITWHNLEDDEMQYAFAEEDHELEEPDPAFGLAAAFPSDPLTGALMGYQEDLLHYHPTYKEAMLLWNVHIENVEPICKVLHIPSATKMAEDVTREPQAASRANECILFAVYHFAIFSLTQEKCEKIFSRSRSALLQKFHFATRQALVNASFLTSADTSVIQALILFLLACRHHYDPDRYWILTGVAVRIAQRMGLHRDGEALGLSPFDVQMRRRLFYQLIPLDGIASQLSGTGIAIPPESWDTKEPLNINDDQIWPEMTAKPQEQKGATDMMFCLARACIGKFFAKSMRGASMDKAQHHSAIEPLIKEAESEVEEKYIRYCDVVNPLHFLTIGMARSAITAMRIKTRLPRVRDQIATDEERKELFQLAHKIIDTDTAAYANAGIQRYHWHVSFFWAYGTWDSLIYVLTSLRRSGMLSGDEIEDTWIKVEQIYNNHGDLLTSKRALHIAFRSLTLKAWDSNPPSDRKPEPDFISVLRSRRKGKLAPRATKFDNGETSSGWENDEMSPTGQNVTTTASSNFDSVSGELRLDMNSDFSLDTDDWALWDQLIRGENAQRAL